MKHIGFIIKFALSAGILVALCIRLNVDTVKDVYEGFSLPAWIAATALVAAQSFLLAWRWKLLVNIGKIFLGLQKSVSINFISQLANMVFITSIGGLVARVTLTMPCGVSFQKCVAASVIDRFMTLCALMIIAILFMPVFAMHMQAHFAYVAIPFIAAGVIALIALTPLLTVRIYAKVKPFTSTPRLRALRRYGGAFFGRPRIYGKTILLSLFAQAAFFVSVIVLTRAAGVSVETLSLLSMLPVIALVSSIPLSIGGWGVREGAFVYGYGLLGIPMHTAFMISVQVGLIGMLATVLLGIPALMLSKTPAFLRGRPGNAQGGNV